MPKEECHGRVEGRGEFKTSLLIVNTSPDTLFRLFLMSVEPNRLSRIDYFDYLQVLYTHNYGRLLVPILTRQQNFFLYVYVDFSYLGFLLQIPFFTRPTTKKLIKSEHAYLETIHCLSHFSLRIVVEI